MEMRAADEDGEAVGWFEAEQDSLAAEDDDGELGFAVLEGEVEMAGGGESTVGDFTLDPEVGVAGLDLLADFRDEGRGRSRCGVREGVSRTACECEAAGVLPAAR